jgi:hypothetical protein
VTMTLYCGHLLQGNRASSPKQQGIIHRHRTLQFVCKKIKISINMVTLALEQALSGYPVFAVSLRQRQPLAFPLLCCRSLINRTWR